MKCETCRWAADRKEHTREKPVGREGGFFTGTTKYKTVIVRVTFRCHFNPPQYWVVGAAGPDDAIGATHSGYGFPIVNANTWCSRWSAKALGTVANNGPTRIETNNVT